MSGEATLNHRIKNISEKRYVFEESLTQTVLFPTLKNKYC